MIWVVVMVPLEIFAAVTVCALISAAVRPFAAIHVAVTAPALMLLPLTACYGFPLVYFVYCFAVAALVVYQHRDNIRRLRQGVERQLW